MKRNAQILAISAARPGATTARHAQWLMIAFTQWHDPCCRLNELPHAASLPL
jgi:hypothetical protein